VCLKKLKEEELIFEVKEMFINKNHKDDSDSFKNYFYF